MQKGSMRKRNKIQCYAILCAKNVTICDNTILTYRRLLLPGLVMQRQHDALVLHPGPGLAALGLQPLQQPARLLLNLLRHRGNKSEISGHNKYSQNSNLPIPCSVRMPDVDAMVAGVGDVLDADLVLDVRNAAPSNHSNKNLK